MLRCTLSQVVLLLAADASVAIAAMTHDATDVANFKKKLGVMKSLQKYYRERYQAMIRMRRHRAIKKNWKFDEIRKVAIPPPEEIKRREEIQRRKEQKAARRGKRGRPKGSRGRKGLRDASSTSPAPKRSKRGDASNVLQVDESKLDVSNLDEAVHGPQSKYSHLSYEDLLTELSVRDGTIKHQVSYLVLIYHTVFERNLLIPLGVTQ